MKKLKYILLLMLMAGAAIPLSAQSNLRSLNGIWEGTLNLGFNKLKLVLAVSDTNGMTVAELDSPDQYVSGITVNYFVRTNDSVNFGVFALDCKFKGVWQGDSIVGKFIQHGKKIPLTLRPTMERKLFLRPQEPKEPFPYQQVEMDFPYRTDRKNVTGTLTLPESGTPSAVVILISGSGWQDRNESIMGHKPFLLLSDQLTRSGYAVFRYDDAPASDFQTMTTLDFAQQVRVIRDTLAQRAELKNVPIGLLGHSEGGMVAWIVASQVPDVSFVISMAGMGTSIKDILLYQVMKMSVNQGAEPGFLVSSQQLCEHTYSIVEKAKKPEKAKEQVENFLTDYAKNMTFKEQKSLGITPLEIHAKANALCSEWFFTLFHLQPEKYMRKVECPVLALNGDKDTQVEAVRNIDNIRNSVKDNTLNRFEIVPNVNHLFQECETGFSEEYGEIDQTISPDVITMIIDWLKTVDASRH